MINPQWLELPMSRINFHGPKDVRAIEVRLYFDLESKQFSNVYYQDDERQSWLDKWLSEHVPLSYIYIPETDSWREAGNDHMTISIWTTKAVKIKYW